MQAVLTFPRPKTAADIFIANPYINRGYSSLKTYSHLCDPAAIDVHQRPEIIAAPQIKIRSTTRLLFSQGWVLKTDISRAEDYLNNVSSNLQQYLAAVESVNAWHADKYWFILRADGKYWPCSACPQLTMLSELGDWKKKLYWWGHMFLLSLKVIQESKKSLDIDPANFGYQPSQDRAYYVGDKVYSVGSVREVGRAILRRLPEEEEIPEDKWHTFGLFLNQLFHPLMTSRYDWEALTNGADDIPLARHFYYKKEALIKGLLKERDYVYSNNGSGNHHHARRPRSYS